MKKIRQLLTLLLAFVGIESYAEVITTTPVEDGSAITEGYYVIRTNKKIGEGNNFITAKENYVKWVKTTEVTDEYVWKLESDGNNGFYMKNIAKQLYIGNTANTTTPTSTSSTVYKMVLSENKKSITFDYIGNTENGSQYKISTQGYTFHCEAPNYSDAFVVNWGSDIDGASAWCIEKVDETQGEELNKKYEELVSFLTINKVDQKGATFATDIEAAYKGTSYTLNPEEENYYTYASTAVDGTTTNESSFIVTQPTHEITYSYTYNIPFTSNEINGSFPEDTHWYLMKVRGSHYVKYNTTDPSYLEITSEKGLGEEYWWTFSGDYENGIKIYNKAAGADKIMRSLSPSNDGNNGGNTYPHMVEATAEDGSLNTEWTIYPSTLVSGENGFFLSREGESAKLNQFGGSSATKLAFYTNGADIGSTFSLVPFEDELAKISGYAPDNIYAVGTLKESLRNSYTESLNKKSPEGLKEASTIVSNNENIIPLVSNSYYRILNLARGTYYMTVSDEKNVIGTETSLTNASQIWKIASGTTTDTYKLSAQNTYLQNSEWNTTVKANTEETSAQEYKFNARQGFPGFYALKPNSGNPELHLASGKNVVGYNGVNAGRNEASSWMLIPTNSIDINITNAGYATINYPFAVELPSELTAYTGNIDGNKFILTEVSGKVIPANSPVIVEGAAGTHSLTILADNTDVKLETGLQGTCLSQTIDAADETYVLANPAQGNGVGFYLLTNEGETPDRTIGQNKAYLTTTNASGIKAFTFDLDGGATGIESTEATVETAEEYYDLQGRRVANPTKGIYVTKSGKKVLFTK